MNPARSLAPALVSLHLDIVWIYLTAPVAGALLAVLHAAVSVKKAAVAPRRRWDNFRYKKTKVHA
ncbi:MAG: hypothetical protein DME26_16595 [Verrucomicrobia bacterium]|nr:MAG: hypothetical protein DME26_16595 [Verrucomicrobiota bacterium]